MSATRSYVVFPLHPSSPFLHPAPQLTTHDFIHKLADRLGHHGVATRAHAIFDSAMQRTSMKWGKAAKLAAGAAVVFAMREQGRGDRTHHLAVSLLFFLSPFFFFQYSWPPWPLSGSFVLSRPCIAPYGRVLAPPPYDPFIV